MTQIVPFEGGKVPAYLKNFAAEVNGDLLSHQGTSFPIISIKGKIFTVSREGERNVIPNPKDPESPATYINVVMVKANKATSKVFYMKGYVDGSDDKPDCFSNDGVRPDPSVEKPVSKTCSTCPKNVWGSKITDAGKKVKACTDSVRIAVATPNAIDDPYFIRVPPASIKNLGKLGDKLNKAGVDYRAVIIKVSFDPDQATPLLHFTPVGYLDEESYKKAVEVSEGDVVQAIMGSSSIGIGEDEEEEEAVEKAAAPAPAPAPAEKKTKTKPAPVVEEEEVVEAVKSAKPKVAAGGFADVDIEQLDFD